MLRGPVVLGLANAQASTQSRQVAEAVPAWSMSMRIERTRGASAAERGAIRVDELTEVAVRAARHQRAGARADDHTLSTHWSLASSSAATGFARCENRSTPPTAPPRDPGTATRTAERHQVLYDGGVRGLPFLVVCACRIHFDPLADEGAADAPTSDATIDGSPLACGPSYVPLGVGPSRYLVEALDLVTWVSAEQRCELDGAHLVIIDDESERLTIESALTGSSQWVGISERVTRGAFRTVTNVSPSFLPWGPAEPSGSIDDCVQLDATTKLLDDQDCTSVRRYVCECDGVPGVPAAYGGSG